MTFICFFTIEPEPPWGQKTFEELRNYFCSKLKSIFLFVCYLAGPPCFKNLKQKQLVKTNFFFRTNLLHESTLFLIFFKELNCIPVINNYLVSRVISILCLKNFWKDPIFYRSYNFFSFRSLNLHLGQESVSLVETLEDLLNLRLRLIISVISLSVGSIFFWVFWM